MNDLPGNLPLGYWKNSVDVCVIVYFIEIIRGCSLGTLWGSVSAHLVESAAYANIFIRREEVYLGFTALPACTLLYC